MTLTENQTTGFAFDLSVLVTPTKSGGSLCKLVGSLLRHLNHYPTTQIVVVVPESQNSERLLSLMAEIKSRGAELVVISIDQQKPSDVPNWRALAYQAASGRICVFIEDNAVVESGWCEAWRESGNQGDWVIASGLVIPDSDRMTKTAAGVFFCEYGLFMPAEYNRQIYPLNRVAGNHWAVNRQQIPFDGDLNVIDEHDWVQKYASKFSLPYWNESAFVKCEREIKLREAVLERVRQGFQFGRGQAKNAGWLRRAKMIHGGPGIIIMQLGRLFYVIIQRRSQVRLFATSLPWTVGLIKAWSLAELAGWMVGTMESLLQRNLQNRAKNQSQIANDPTAFNAGVIGSDENAGVSFAVPDSGSLDGGEKSGLKSQRVA